MKNGLKPMGRYMIPVAISKFLLVSECWHMATNRCTLLYEITWRTRKFINERIIKDKDIHVSYGIRYKSLGWINWLFKRHYWQDDMRISPTRYIRICGWTWMYNQ